MEATETVLFLSESGFYPAKDGKRQRTEALVSALSKFFRVEFVIIGSESDFKLAQSLSFKNVRFHFVPNSDSLPERLMRNTGYLFSRNSTIERAVQKIGADMDARVVFTRYLTPAKYSIRGLPLIIDLDDDPLEVFSSSIRTSRNLFRRFRFWVGWRINQSSRWRLLNTANKIFVSKVEMLGGIKSVVLPNLPFQVKGKRYESMGSASPFNLLFVGKLSYRPNSSGLLWFLANVWPDLLKVNFYFNLTIVSSVAPTDQQLRAMIDQSTNVTLFINALNINDYYNRSSIIIAPIFDGGGTSIKVIEALYFAKPVVATTFALRGLENFMATGLLLRADSAISFREVLLSSADQISKGLMPNVIDLSQYFHVAFENWESLLITHVNEVLSVNNHSRRIC